MAFVETLVSVMSCDSDRLNMTTAPEAMDRKGEIPQNVDKDLQTGLNLNSDSHVMMTLESDEEHDLDLYMEPDVEPELQPALEQHLYSKKTLGISDATESTERELCSSHNEKDKPICTIVHCTSTRDVPDIHPVPGKCRVSHYSVLPGPGKKRGPGKKKKKKKKFF